MIGRNSCRQCEKIVDAGQDGRNLSETLSALAPADHGPLTAVARNQDPPSAKLLKSGVRRIPAQSPKTKLTYSTTGGTSRAKPALGTLIVCIIQVAVNVKRSPINSGLSISAAPSPIMISIDPFMRFSSVFSVKKDSATVLGVGYEPGAPGSPVPSPASNAKASVSQ